MDVLEGIFDDKILRILRLFLDNPEEYFHINKVSKRTKVPLATTFRIMKLLLEQDIIKYNEISKFKIYKLASNKKTKKLGKIL